MHFAEIMPDTTEPPAIRLYRNKTGMDIPLKNKITHGTQGGVSPIANFIIFFRSEIHECDEMLLLIYRSSL